MVAKKMSMKKIKYIIPKILIDLMARRDKCSSSE